MKSSSQILPWPHRLTVVLPCFGRPERTKRMIDCLRRQTVNNVQMIIIGDGCPEFEKIISSKWFHDFFFEQLKKRNYIMADNLTKHMGGFGYDIINTAIRNAKGRYFMFLGNDDVIKDNHFEHYLNGIEGTCLDFVYFNTWVDPHDMIRMAQPIQGSIGHSELIVRTEFAQTVEPHDPEYGHDWRFIENMMKKTTWHRKVNDESPTYIVMSVPGKTKDTID